MSKKKVSGTVLKFLDNLFPDDKFNIISSKWALWPFGLARFGGF
jgi:hypothetical protein